MNDFTHSIKKFVLIIVLFLLAGCGQQINHSPHANLKAISPHYATIENGKMEYYQFGTGSPIILIAGYLTDISSWNCVFLESLAKQHQVILINNRNIGGTKIQSSRYETQDLANDTYQLIESLKLKKPAVLGISMGGMIAQQLAVLHQKKLGQLILINTAIAGSQAIHPSQDVEEKMRDMPKNKLKLCAAAINLFFPPNWRMKVLYPLVVDRFLPKNYVEMDPDMIKLPQQNLIRHWIDDNATANKIKKLDLPVLVLNGDADIVLPSVNSDILANTIPHARLIRWKDGGHAMLYQYPVQIANAVNNFLASS